MNELKAQLAEQEIELTKKNEEADKLIEIVGIETEKVSKEKAIADEEELKVSQWGWWSRCGGAVVVDDAVVVDVGGGAAAVGGGAAAVGGGAAFWLWNGTVGGCVVTCFQAFVILIYDSFVKTVSTCLGNRQSRRFPRNVTYKSTISSSMLDITNLFSNAGGR